MNFGRTLYHNNFTRAFPILLGQDWPPNSRTEIVQFNEIIGFNK